MQLLEQCQEYIPQLDSIDVESIPQLDARDPTGTADLRAAFERDLKDRWQRLDRCLNNAVATSDVLSLSPNGAMALIPAADRTKQFRSWLDELLSHLIVAGGDWMRPYLDEAGERASSRAAGLDPRKDAGGVLPTAPRIAGHTTDTMSVLATSELRGICDAYAQQAGYEDTMLVLATSELQGICDAYAQQATRIAAHAALVRWRPAKAAQGIRQLTATVGLARSRMMADYLIVKAFGCATLDAFREAGVRHVGTVAETLPHAHLDDAARKTPQHRHPVHGRFITKTEATREWGRRSSGKFGKAPKAYNRSIAHRKALRAAAAAGEEEVNVLTAGDDRVCQACQAISNAGPYPIDEAMDLIPAHPRCRCAYVPAGFKGGSNPLGIHT
jgi:hypothetical protein